jgi:hypothetical protein
MTAADLAPYSLAVSATALVVSSSVFLRDWRRNRPRARVRLMAASWPNPDYV